MTRDDFHPEYDPDYQEVFNNKDCPHDTRTSRSSPLTQNDNGDCLIICRHCGKVTQVQCNESAQARKDVLEKLRKWSIVQYEISGIIDTMTLKQKIESLRTEGGDE